MEEITYLNYEVALQSNLDRGREKNYHIDKYRMPAHNLLYFPHTNSTLKIWKCKSEKIQNMYGGSYRESNGYC